jgi:hypothetical protein
MSIADIKKSKITGVKLHTTIFIGGTQLGPTILSKDGTRNCSFKLDGDMLFVTLVTKNITTAVSLASVIQIDYELEEKVEKNS